MNGLSEVGYYHREGKTFSLSHVKTWFCFAAEEINVEGTVCICCVKKRFEDDSEISAPKAKKRTSDAEDRQEWVQTRFELLKKHHGQ